MTKKTEQKKPKIPIVLWGVYKTTDKKIGTMITVGNINGRLVGTLHIVGARAQHVVDGDPYMQTLVLLHDPEILPDIQTMLFDKKEEEEEEEE